MTASADVIQEAERLLTDITPGPWAWESIAEKSNEWVVGQAFDAAGKPLDGRLPEGEWIEDTVIERRLVGMNESGHANFADAAFIAAAPRLVRQLVAAFTEQALPPAPDPGSPAEDARVQALRDEMRQRERDLFYTTYPRLPNRDADESARAGALSEVQMWREKIDTLLTSSAPAVSPEGSRQPEHQEKD